MSLASEQMNPVIREIFNTLFMKIQGWTDTVRQLAEG